MGAVKSARDLVQSRDGTPATYLNEIEPFAAAWLRNLGAAGLIPVDHVDERSIVDVQPDDLDGFGECHFFAGIGGWPLALKLAGWQGPVWTGSCPCQPLSGAGKRKGHADERHLWPAFYRLIAKCQPAVIFGEQVASKDGREWLAGVRADLEALGYAVGAADLCAASVGAPHIRQRLFWVADAGHNVRSTRSSGDKQQSTPPIGAEHRSSDTGTSGPNDFEILGRFSDGRYKIRRWVRPMADAYGGNASAERIQRGGQPGNDGATFGAATGQAAIEAGAWDRAEWLRCSDGKARRAEPSIFPLAHGVSSRLGKLRAAGNAIVPQVGAHFVASFMAAQGQAA